MTSIASESVKKRLFTDVQYVIQGKGICTTLRCVLTV